MFTNGSKVPETGCAGAAVVSSCRGAESEAVCISEPLVQWLGNEPSVHLTAFQHR